MVLTAVSDALTANDRRNLLIAQRRADDVHSGGRRDLGKLSPDIVRGYTTLSRASCRSGEEWQGEFQLAGD